MCCDCAVYFATMPAITRPCLDYAVYLLCLGAHIVQAACRLSHAVIFVFTGSKKAWQRDASMMMLMPMKQLNG